MMLILFIFPVFSARDGMPLLLSDLIAATQCNLFWWALPLGQQTSLNDKMFAGPYVVRPQPHTSGRRQHFLHCCGTLSRSFYHFITTPTWLVVGYHYQRMCIFSFQSSARFIDPAIRGEYGTFEVAMRYRWIMLHQGLYIWAALLFTWPQVVPCHYHSHQEIGNNFPLYQAW